MKLSDVIALIGAGYTKEEIEALENMDSANKPKVETLSEPAPAPDAQKPEAQPETKPETKAENVGNKELLEAISGLTKAIQIGNIRNTPQPAKSVADSVEKNADNALMEIYNL